MLIPSSSDISNSKALELILSKTLQGPVSRRKKLLPCPRGDISGRPLTSPRPHYNHLHSLMQIHSRFISIIAMCYMSSKLGMQIMHTLGIKLDGYTGSITYGNGKKIYKFSRFKTSNYLETTQPSIHIYKTIICKLSQK